MVNHPNRSTSGTIQHAYEVGQQIECLDLDGRWRPAHVNSLAPTKGRPGYYIVWADIDWTAPRKNDAPTPSSGGWVYEAFMRPAA